MTNRNRLKLLMTASLAVAGLTACTSSSPEAGRPDTAAPSTAASSASASTPVTKSPGKPPERPAAAQGLSLAAAEAFVRYYSDLMNYSSDSGDVSAMLGASDAGCEACKAYADFVKKSNAANGLLTGDYYEHVTEVSELVRGANGRLGGSAVVTIGKYVSRDKPSASPFTTPATTYTREVALSAQGGSWVMYELRQEAQ
ncbi:hypothetical protein FB561_2640 [Kribbella amoyensis]|uniref:DUF6318 domain-containing protein n=1 Tax=Kribbella amoyensis TaxID=996641 RepID=A0A561BRL1_9ACTN|nr:DUF6318 family protein [Kribbella amoyensis]TWD81524.1 hypothetical protein FB561_2640 [Kribbella amoyensis]